MNLLDQFQQDQEAAKAALGAALNQKAFDLLDTYASNQEVEVVTFEDESLTEEDLDAMSDEEFEAIDEEQLDEASVKLNLGYYEVHHEGKRVGKYVAKYEAKEHAAQLNDDSARAQHRNTRDDVKARQRPTAESMEDLSEGLGSLAGLSKHLIKTVTKDTWSGRTAGEHSDVEAHPIKNKSAHRAVLNKALDDGHVPVVYVNGKIHAAAHSTGAGYGRTEFNVHGADAQQTQKEVHYHKPYRSGGRMIYPTTSSVSDNPRYKKGDALEKLTPGHDASFYKENKVEVKVIKPDPVRLKLKKERGENAPQKQDNYVKTVKGDKNASSYVDGKTKTSTTSAGDNLKAIKDAAALKLATKKLSGDSSANKKAMELHAELGKHLAAGKHREAIRAASDLADHVRNQGLETHADKIKDYAKNLEQLKSSWGKDSAKRTMARLRGDKTNESTELVEALEAMLTEMLDINEGYAVGKTVWTSHTDKPLKGKIVSKDDDNEDHYIVACKDGQHAVHQDHIHGKEEHAKYMYEAIVPGSVKKDAKGNVLSFKSVGDKNPEKEYDDSVKKDLEARKKHNSDFGKNEEVEELEEVVRVGSNTGPGGEFKQVPSKGSSTTSDYQRKSAATAIKQQRNSNRAPDSSRASGTAGPTKGTDSSHWSERNKPGTSGNNLHGSNLK